MSKKTRFEIRHRNRPGGKAEPRKSEQTRQSILDAALKFLWTHPFRELTVGELMSLAGTGRSAFYHYFEDLHDLMEALLRGMEEDVFNATAPWFTGEGDPISLLQESLENMVQVFYQRGPIVRAVSDSAPMDERLEKAWTGFMKDCDDAVTNRIEQHQAAGLIKPFDARPVAMALNQMNAYLMIRNFGRQPRGNQESVRNSIVRVWISTLYGDKALSNFLSTAKTPTTVKK